MPKKYQPVVGETAPCSSCSIEIPSGAKVVAHKFDNSPKGYGDYKIQLFSNGTGLNGSDTILEFGITEDAYKALILIYDELN